MGYNLPGNNVPENGSAAVRFGPRRQRLASCGSAAWPPRSAMAEALRAPRLFALVVADVADVDEATGAEDTAGLFADADAVTVDDLPATEPEELDLAPEDEVEDQAGHAVGDGALEGDGRPGDVVVWGLAFPSRAVVFLHNPLTGRDDFGLFETPEGARRFYSLFGELHLVYV